MVIQRQKLVCFTKAGDKVLRYYGMRDRKRERDKRAPRTRYECIKKKRLKYAREEIKREI